ncbi:nucleotide sugar dehydrogenase [bacterium]|nr:nucleotide sugar dehydrogenase [bacterium]
MTNQVITEKSVSESFLSLRSRINSREAVVGIIGMGYVGLPLACEFAHEGISVVGFDVSEEKVSKLNNGTSYIQDITEDTLKPLVDQKLIRATSDFADLKNVDIISICVPTPLRKTKDPDMSYILSAIESIAPHLRKGQLVILESTTYPGTTEEILLPRFEETGLKVGEDFFLAFSPERVDPGNSTFNTKNTPKVIGGVTPQCSELAQSIYAVAIDTLVLVSSPSSAELVKLYENTFRAVNIGMANEMALMCHKLGIDVFEVIDAAATKPFGFMPFYPGPGLGGHCIPIDPHYLSWKLKTLNYDPKFIGLAEQINSSMPNHVVNRVNEALNAHQKSINGSKILILGVAYKPNINDLRESPALDIIGFLQDKGAEISYHDSYNPVMKIRDFEKKSKPLTSSLLNEADCVVIVTNHKDVSIDFIVKESPLIVDARNATKGYTDSHSFRI